MAIAQDSSRVRSIVVRLPIAKKDSCIPARFARGYTPRLYLREGQGGPGLAGISRNCAVFRATEVHYYRSRNITLAFEYISHIIKKFYHDSSQNFSEINIFLEFFSLLFFINQ